MVTAVILVNVHAVDVDANRIRVLHVQQTIIVTLIGAKDRHGHPAAAESKTFHLIWSCESFFLFFAGKYLSN